MSGTDYSSPPLALLRTFCLDQLYELPDIRKLADFGRGKFYAERFLHGQYEAYMVETVPAIDVAGC